MGFQLVLLLRHAHSRNESRGLWLAERTLEQMARGGIYDHLGGGICRYSTDSQWLVPHFEKMLYDNALVADAYIEGFLFANEEQYRHTAEEIFDFLLDEMRDQQGAFFGAQDADTEGEEGAYYLWTTAEIQEVLGTDQGVLFCQAYGVSSPGNFREKNILHVAADMQKLADSQHMTLRQLEGQLMECRKQLLKKRAQRERPLIDQKIITSWNGLLIHSLARAGMHFGSEHYLQAAKQAARFVRHQLWRNGALVRRWCDGEAAFEGGLDDYAAMIRAALTLFDATGDSEWLDWAFQLNAVLDTQFCSEGGVYFQIPADSKENVLVRRTQFPDGSEPSGNALQCENLLKLHLLTGQQSYLSGAEAIFKAVRPFVELYPIGYTYHLLNMTRYYDKHRDLLVIALGADEKENKEVLKEIRQLYRPHRQVVIRHQDDSRLLELLPHLQHQKAVDERVTLYRCFSNRCEAPVVGLSAIQNLLLGESI